MCCIYSQTPGVAVDLIVEFVALKVLRAFKKAFQVARQLEVVIAKRRIKTLPGKALADMFVFNQDTKQLVTDLGLRLSGGPEFKPLFNG